METTTSSPDQIIFDLDLAPEARPAVTKVLAECLGEDIKSALQIIADECYWRDPNNTRYDYDRCRYPIVSKAEEAEIKASISPDVPIGAFLFD